MNKSPIGTSTAIAGRRCLRAPERASISAVTAVQQTSQWLISSNTDT